MLDQNMLAYIVTTAKSFEYVIVFCCVILFLLITVYITLRQARKLPKSYIVEVVDVNGQKVAPGPETSI
jgi:Na+/H+ antiporter NhaC